MYFHNKFSHLPAKTCHFPSPELKIIGTCDGARHNPPMAGSSGGVLSHCDFITPTAIIVMKNVASYILYVRICTHIQGM